MENDTLKGKKVLIVEDNLASRLYLNKILEKTGVIILNSGDGKEAVEMLLKTPDIDMVLMDIQLPVLDGYTAARQIRDMGRNTILIAQTAYGMAEDMDKILAAGFNDYMIKPIFSEQLIEKLSSYLNK